MSLWPETRRALWLERDRRWAIALHRAADSAWLLPLLMAASRLGDGALWYVTIALLPLLDTEGGARCALQMTAVGLVNLLLYASLKRYVGRPRPFVDCPGIRACTRALDRYSFPSGHMLHASAFGLLLAAHHPALAAPLLAFALLVAASRVVLGLHYPSDVVAGAATGLLTAGLALAISG